MNYCPYCPAVFFHLDALAAHRKTCGGTGAGTPKPKEKEKEDPMPDQYDGWRSIG